MTTSSKKYSPEVRQRAVRMVFEHRGEHESQWAAIESIAAKIGCTAQTLRGWVRQTERDTGQREGLSSADKERIKALEREVRELLPKPTRFCARPLHILLEPCSTAPSSDEGIH